MQTRLSFRSRGGLTRDVEVSAPSGTTLLDLHPYLRAALSDVEVGRSAPSVGPRSVGLPPRTPGPAGRHDPDAPVLLWAGSRALPPGALLGGPGLRDGCILGVDTPGPRDPVAQAVVRLQVVGGPDAGTVTALPRGAITVGRGPECDVRLNDPAISRRQLELTVTASGIRVRDLASSNGSRLLSTDATPAEEITVTGRDLPVREYLSIGESVVCVAAVDIPAAVTTLADSGRLVVNRPPRLGAVLIPSEIVFAEPAARRPPSLPWLAALLPAVGGAALAWFLHNVQFLAFALLSPVLMLATGLGERLTGRRGRRRGQLAERRREAQAQEQLRAACTVETWFRRRAHPDPVAVLHTAVTPDARIWERRRTDADFLDVRLGLRDSAAALSVRRGTHGEPSPVLGAVPVSTSLRLGPLGLCGPRPLVLGVARWVIGQLVTLHSPADLAVIALLGEQHSDDWAWLRWLPHARAETGVDSPASSSVLVARTTEERHAAIAELLGRTADEANRSSRAWTGPWTVVVIDRASAMSEVTGLGKVLDQGHLAGITAVCVDDDERRLPPACTSVGRLTGELGTRIQLGLGVGHRGSPATTDVGTEPSRPGIGSGDLLADRVSDEWAERVARGLAPLADPGDEQVQVPRTVRLRDLVTGGFDPSAVRRRWADGDGRAWTPIGVGTEGVVDIDLGRDGPHALVAGTTGAGKSELLQSLVAGMAAHAAPTDLQFVLIDYKGGAAFADCARLPHTAGLVTDLDGHLTQRALLSLHAELRRREGLFADAGAVDLAAYRRSHRHRHDRVGRLVLVVDEFAALAEELPDFVSGLVGIAQRGRSLGVHLILATQRPGGVVSPEIRANTALRIALRVTDPAESGDVIGCDDAARIDKLTPGRAAIRIGSAVRAVQIGRVAGPADLPGPRIDIVALDRWGARPDRPGPAAAEARTDLQELVDALRTAADAAGVASPARGARPWLDPLPAHLDLLAVPGSATARTEVALGLIDRPAEQRQDPLSIDVAVGSSWLLAGGIKSGRTTALRSLGARACDQLEVDELHLYGIDCAGGGLSALAAFPHCGGIVARTSPATIMALLTRLSAEVAARQMHLAGLGVGTMAEAARLGAPRPAILLLLDNWEGFLAAVDHVDAGRCAETLIALMREGAATGVTTVLTGDRGALSTRLSSAVQRRLILRLSDPADYAMAGLPRRAVPTSMPPGRCLDPVDATEAQLGLFGDDPAMGAQLSEIEKLVQRARARCASVPEALRPFRIRSLPGRVTVGELDTVVPAGVVLLGAGGDDAGPVALRTMVTGDRTAADPRFLVAGPPRSGRSTVLALIARQLVAGGSPVLIAAGSQSPLCTLAREHGLMVVTPGQTDDHRLEADLDRVLTGSRPGVLLVDDAELFTDTASGERLTEMVRSRSSGLAVFASGRSEDLAVTFRGVAAEVKRARTGLLLRPEAGDGDLLGVRIPFGRVSAPVGRGVLVAGELLYRPMGTGDGRIDLERPDPPGDGSHDDRRAIDLQVAYS